MPNSVEFTDILNTGVNMSRYIEGQDRQQVTLLPECLDDFIAEDNTVRIVDVFINEVDLVGLGFDGATPAATGRPSYHPAVLLKLYLYGYLNRIQSSRRLERECQRNVELMWLTQRLAPDFKTIADFRRDNGQGIRNVCRRFVELWRWVLLVSRIPSLRGVYSHLGADGCNYVLSLPGPVPQPNSRIWEPSVRGVTCASSTLSAL